MENFNYMPVLKIVGILIVLGILASFGASGFEVIDTGKRGVEIRFGKVVSESLPEGMYFVNPITTNIIELDVREQRWDSSSQAYTKDVQNLTVAFTLNYSPDPTKIHILYERVGKTWSEKLIPQVVQARVKEVIGQYEAVKLVSDRHAAIKQTAELIKLDLNSKNIDFKSFEITNLDFNDAFEHAVESKVVAIQQAEEAKNKTVKVKEEADQQIITAKAEAESMRIRAQALSQNKGLVEYEAVQKWDGKMPNMMLGNSVPFINITK